MDGYRYGMAIRRLVAARDVEGLDAFIHKTQDQFNAYKDEKNFEGGPFHAYLRTEASYEISLMIFTKWISFCDHFNVYHLEGKEKNLELFCGLVETGVLGRKEFERLFARVYDLRRTLMSCPIKIMERFIDALLALGVDFNCQEKDGYSLSGVMAGSQFRAPGHLWKRGVMDIHVPVNPQESRILHLLLINYHVNDFCDEIVEKFPETLLYANKQGVYAIELALFRVPPESFRKYLEICKEKLSPESLGLLKDIITSEFFLTNAMRGQKKNAITNLKEVAIFTENRGDFVTRTFVFYEEWRKMDLTIMALWVGNFEDAVYFYNHSEHSAIFPDRDMVITETCNIHEYQDNTRYFLLNTLFEWKGDDLFGLKKSAYPPRIYAMALLLKEGILAISTNTPLRFWRFLLLLPLEIVMRICNICYSANPGDNILSDHVFTFLKLIVGKQIKK